jgi:Holliday junction DNA helicase RuvA
MIGRLHGKLALKRAPQVLVECYGVGYEVDVSMTTFYQLPEEGGEVSLWTHLLIKDDQHSLVGFHSERERALFRQLIRINGVGPKMALTILSGISEADFALCVQSGDVSTLTRLPGVGKKTAERLIIEMRDKVQVSPVDHAPSMSGTIKPPAAHSISNEAIEALQALGYKANEAERMIKSLDSTEHAQSAEGLIRQALRNALS